MDSQPDIDDATTTQEHSLDEAQVTELVSLISKHRVDVFRFIYSLLPNHDAAEEICQRATIVMWKKFTLFEPGTSFSTWAKRIAYFEVLAYRKTYARDRLEFWPSDVVDTIANTCFENEDQLQQLARLLQECLDKLSEKDKNLVRLRYENSNTTSRQVAGALGKPAVTIYKGLTRIRKSLFECVQRSMAKEK